MAFKCESCQTWNIGSSVVNDMELCIVCYEDDYKHHYECTCTQHDMCTYCQTHCDCEQICDYCKEQQEYLDSLNSIIEEEKKAAQKN